MLLYDLSDSPEEGNAGSMTFLNAMLTFKLM